MNPRDPQRVVVLGAPEPLLRRDREARQLVRDPYLVIEIVPVKVIETMHVYTLHREQLVPRSPVETFDFFADAFNLEAITPPWLEFEVATPRPIAMGAGALIEYRLKLHALPLRWLTRIEAWDPGRRFADRQLRGPYRLWHHTHAFAADERGTVMRDFVRYALPLGPVGRLARAVLVRRDLDRIFDYRRDAVASRLGSQ
jgi:ligand-binding SRPBCC domain-containing protein